MATVLIGLIALHYLREESHETRQHYSLTSRAVITATYIFFLFQPSAIGATLMLFTCKDVGGVDRLYHQLSIECNSAEHIRWQWGVGLCGLVWGVVIPGLKLELDPPQLEVPA